MTDIVRHRALSPNTQDYGGSLAFLRGADAAGDDRLRMASKPINPDELLALMRELAPT